MLAILFATKQTGSHISITIITKVSFFGYSIYSSGNANNQHNLAMTHIGGGMSQLKNKYSQIIS